ncbi:MAG TPA: transglycosylase domain-containing protein [Candidatus Lumbricidophila sp.]|nr:transglycosylase domain-containing protein [Candidatus Lumbricidophila sp.]
MSAQKRPAGTAGALLGLVGGSALIGVLVTAAVTPALAIAGITANNTITLFENLPSYLSIGALSQKSDIYATQPDGSIAHLASFFDDNRIEVGWDQINQTTKDAAVAAEDIRFYAHGGVDLQGTVRAMLSNVLGNDIQGASSITQQYVKNVLIANGVREAKTLEEQQAAYDEATKTDPTRKLKEMRYAIALEKKESKDNILLGYLNISLFGGVVYGIEAAAQYYYNKHATDLSIAEAASLVAIVQNPELRRLDRPDDPDNGAKTEIAGKAVPYAKNKERRDYIIKAMYNAGKITAAQRDEALDTVITPTITKPSTGCQTAGGSAYFCDYVTKVIQKEYDDPKTTDIDEGDRMLRQGGLKIYTTLDLTLQSAAETAMAAVPQTDPRFDIGGVSVGVEPGTGRILFMTQNKKYSQDPDVLKDPSYSAINLATDYAYGGSNGFQPASTFKIFTLAEWLKEGHSLREYFDGRRRDFTTFPGLCSGGTWNGHYNPNNDNPGDSANNAVDATKYSVNSAFMAMASKLQLCGIKNTAQSFLVKRADGLELGQQFAFNDDGTIKHNADGTPMVNPNAEFQPAAVLGTEEVSPLSMAVAVAGVANNGKTCSAIAIDKIIGPDGATVDVPKSNCVQSVTPEIAHAMQYAMKATFNGGTTGPANPGTGIQHIGKTGTNSNAEDVWMDGASTKLAMVVWNGNITGGAERTSLRSVKVPGTYTRYADLRYDLWSSVMKVSDHTRGGDAFPDPDSSFLQRKLVDLPNVVGLSLDQAKTALTTAGFQVADGGPVDCALPIGQVCSTDPAGQVDKGSTIKLFTSNGALKAVPNVVGMTFDQAKSMLEGAGFTVSQVEQDTQDPTKVGKVLSQNPDSTASVAAGTKVTVVVGKLGPGAGGGGGPGNGGGNH